MAHYSIPIQLTDKKLTQKEVRKLIKLAQDGCKISKDKVVECNLKLVTSIIQRFRHTTESGDDLFQIGCIGLIKAIERFDLERDVYFSTYAVPMILGEIRRHLRDTNRPIKISRSIQDNARKIWSFNNTFLNENGRSPKISDIEKALAIPREDIVQAIASADDILSFSTPISGEDTGDRSISLEDKIADNKNHFEQWIIKEDLSKSLRALDNKEREVIEKRFFFDQTQSEIGEELGISQAQISRLEKKALDKIKRII